jgi:hypothetical protein
MFEASGAPWPPAPVEALVRIAEEAARRKRRP